MVAGPDRMWRAWIACVSIAALGACGGSNTTPASDGSAPAVDVTYMQVDLPSVDAPSMKIDAPSGDAPPMQIDASSVDAAVMQIDASSVEVDGPSMEVGSDRATDPGIIFENSLDGQSGDFGTIALGASSDRIFTVHNTGILTVTQFETMLGGPNASEWSVVGNTCTSPLVPGASCAFTVRFAPISPGAKNATLVVTNSLGAGGAGSAALVGSAVL